MVYLSYRKFQKKVESPKVFLCEKKYKSRLLLTFQIKSFF